MNVWIAASLVLSCGLVPCVIVAARGDLASALAALSVASVIAVAALVTITIGTARSPMIDLAVVLAPMSMIGSFAFARFMERRR